jgi:hypothetical protein
MMPGFRGRQGSVGVSCSLNAANGAADESVRRGAHAEQIAGPDAAQFGGRAEYQGRSAVVEPETAGAHLNGIAVLRTVGHEHRAIVDGLPGPNLIVPEAGFLGSRQNRSHEHDARKDADQHSILPFHDCRLSRGFPSLNLTYHGPLGFPSETCPEVAFGGRLAASRHSIGHALIA